MYDKHNRAITCMFCLDLIKNLTFLCFAASSPGHFDYPSEQRRFGTKHNSSWIFLTSLTGDVKSKITVDDWRCEFSGLLQRVKFKGKWNFIEFFKNKSYYSHVSHMGLRLLSSLSLSLSLLSYSIRLLLLLHVQTLRIQQGLVCGDQLLKTFHLSAS